MSRTFVTRRRARDDLVSQLSLPTLEARTAEVEPEHNLLHVFCCCLGIDVGNHRPGDVFRFGHELRVAIEKGAQRCGALGGGEPGEQLALAFPAR